MPTMLELPITIRSLEPDTQFVNPAATVWPNASHLTRNNDGLLPAALETKQGSKTAVNLPSNPESEPSVEPNKQRRGSKIQVPQDVTPERARYLERNRVAANRSRLKKKQQHEQIQHILCKETKKRETLLAEVNKLREEIWRLKNGVFAHARCGDHQINLQLAKMTQNILGSSLLRPSGFDRPEKASSDLPIASPAFLVRDTVTCAELFDCRIDLPDM
ncbi:hypothetical protein PENANT_c065G11360 [Penicillium antarcticum]|uniref:BZIP domain-containing protein n=1 Tax=Penicillium antarcticum TaxID=416450 RepID=A0A1V6PPZ3_9EURO|nr:hypothetical protein PENANT_c065G11360 [Penicillium antarcticum]